MGKPMIYIRDGSSREYLMEMLAQKVCAAPLIEISRVQCCEFSNARFKYNGDEYKQGLYAIYDRNQNLQYVGMVGDGEGTSIYARMNDHIKHDKWIDVDGCFRFCKFENLNDEQLRIAERLVILWMRPAWNDGGTSQAQIDRWTWVL